MAFPNRKPSMPPPGQPDKKPGVVIAIGSGPKKPDESAPDQPEGDGGKTPDKLERAGVIRADKHCQNCENYVPESGECNELPGNFDPDDACITFYEPLSDSGDPNEAAEGEGEMPPPEPQSAPPTQ